MAKEKTAGEYAEERATAEPSPPSEGITHVDDATYILQAEYTDGDGPAGPEDALSLGDERDNLRGNYEHAVRLAAPHQAVPIPATEQEPGGPTVRIINQRTQEVVE